MQGRDFDTPAPRRLEHGQFLRRDVADRVREGLESSILGTQNNLASTYDGLGLYEQVLRLKRDVYSGYLKLNGRESYETLAAAFNYANSLAHLERIGEAKALMFETIPVARRVLGEVNDLTLRMRGIYGQMLYLDTGATLDDLREAVNFNEETMRTARRVLGGTHPHVAEIESTLRNARAALRARET